MLFQMRIMSFTKWAISHNEPDAGANACLYMGSNQLWYDNPCSARYYPMCQRLINVPVTTMASLDEIRNSPLC